MNELRHFINLKKVLKVGDINQILAPITVYSIKGYGVSSDLSSIPTHSIGGTLDEVTRHLNSHVWEIEEDIHPI